MLLLQRVGAGEGPASWGTGPAHSQAGEDGGLVSRTPGDTHLPGLGGIAGDTQDVFRVLVSKPELGCATLPHPEGPGQQVPPSS